MQDDKEIRLRQLELQAQSPNPASASACYIGSTMPDTGPSTESIPGSFGGSRTSSACPGSFSVSQQIALVPTFYESEVDTYFTVFECVATLLQWPKEIWLLLLQCKLVGKDQEVCLALSLEDSLQYNVVKSAILAAYELVPRTALL